MAGIRRDKSGAMTRNVYRDVGRPMYTDLYGSAGEAPPPPPPANIITDFDGNAITDFDGEPITDF